jgi:predicted DNA binding CopG/RHH family protein
MIKLDKEEQELLRSYEKGEWREIPNMRNEIKKYRGYARATLRKEKRVNIRMSQRDLDSLQMRAIEEGLPYQTLISSILHKYINGRLKEKVA